MTEQFDTPSEVQAEFPRLFQCLGQCWQPVYAPGLGSEYTGGWHGFQAQPTWPASSKWFSPDGDSITVQDLEDELARIDAVIDEGTITLIRVDHEQNHFEKDFWSRGSVMIFSGRHTALAFTKNIGIWNS
jgi:hypothetical protein